MQKLEVNNPHEIYAALPKKTNHNILHLIRVKPTLPESKLLENTTNLKFSKYTSHTAGLHASGEGRRTFFHKPITGLFSV